MLVSFCLKHNRIQTFIPLQSDTDECSENSAICGLGTCSNNENGNFYDCNCPPGSQETGSNTDGSLTCVGECIIPLLCVTIQTKGLCSLT